MADDSADGARDAAGARGLRELAANIRHIPANVRKSIVRHGAPSSSRTSSQTVFSNLFLHIHSVRIHRWTLRKTFTMGLGIASAALFVILLLTGVMLMVYFKPTTAEAYNSIKDIHYVVPGGRLLRNVHRWSANAMVVTVMLHMMRVFFTASYKAPREFNWSLGIGLLVLTLALSFTGYCLPWDQLAYWAVVIGSNIAASPTEITNAIGITNWVNLGDFQRTLLLGSRTIGDDAILRFYWLHCIALPILMTGVIGMHFWRIRKDGGMSRPGDIRPEELAGIPDENGVATEPEPEQKTYGLMCVVEGSAKPDERTPADTVQSWPHAFRLEALIFAVVLGGVIAAGIFMDAPLKIAANPSVPENPAKAPWYFLGLQEVVSYSAFAGGIALPVLAVIALLLIPYLDRERGPSGRWPRGVEIRWIIRSVALSTIFIISILAFRVSAGWLRDWFPEINQLWIVLLNPGTITMAVFSIYSLGVVYWTRSTRLGAIALFCTFMVFFVLFTYFGTMHRGPNWDFYWWPSQWSSH